MLFMTNLVACFSWHKHAKSPHVNPAKAYRNVSLYFHRCKMSLRAWGIRSSAMAIGLDQLTELIFCTLSLHRTSSLHFMLEFGAPVFYSTIYPDRLLFSNVIKHPLSAIHSSLIFSPRTTLISALPVVHSKPQPCRPGAPPQPPKKSPKPSPPKSTAKPVRQPPRGDLPLHH